MSICPVLSLSSTIINDSSYFCRLYRHRCKERNKNCCHAEFTPDKQHPRGDLTLQFALTHRGKSQPYSDTFPVQTYFANQSCSTKQWHRGLYFPTAQRRKAAKKKEKKLRCGRVFMENMNEGSMQLLCLLISPQGWGTLRLYSFTTTDGLLRDVHCASFRCVYVCVCQGLGGGDQTHSCLL